MIGKSFSSNLEGSSSLFIQFPFVRHYMLKNGANPFIVGTDDSTEAAMWKIPTKQLHMPKSIYHTVVSYTCNCLQSPCSNPFSEPWYYTNGVFGYKFTRIVGRGGESTVIESEVCGTKVALKYVKVKTRKAQLSLTEDLHKQLLQRLNELVQYKTIDYDTLIVPFYGHFRFVT